MLSQARRDGYERLCTVTWSDYGSFGRPMKLQASVWTCRCQTRCEIVETPHRVHARTHVRADLSNGCDMPIERTKGDVEISSE